MTQIAGPVSAEYAGLRMTADDYFDVLDEGQRYELVNGVVMMSTSPSRSHQAAALEIAKQIAVYLDDHPIGQVLMDIGVDLGRGPEGDLVYRPDIVFLRSELLAGLGERIRGVVPDLIVEVISPMYRRYDTETKKDDYERVGIHEYWVIDPQRREMHFWRHVSNRYQDVTPSGDAFSSTAVPGFTLDLLRVRRSFDSPKS